MTNDNLAVALGELPYATAKSLRILGKIRQQPEDFLVDEVPVYLPSGHGDHLFLRFRKRQLNTQEAATRIALALDTDPRQASWAGLKDREAVTTQWLSVLGGDANRALELTLPGIEILEAARHPHKLRNGHLRANRFRLRIVCDPAQAPTIQAVADELLRRGIPNYYGEQRFGGDNLRAARSFIIDGGKPPRDRFRRKLLVSVLQSAIFNEWLAERLRDDLFDSALEGDLMRREDSGGLFVATELPEAAERMQRWEVSPTGPICGTKMPKPDGPAAERESALIARWGVPQERWQRLGKLALGARRPSRVRLESFSLRAETDALWLEFELPRGAYATVLLREMLKPEESGAN